MKTITWSSILLFSALFMCAFIPQASAKHHSRSFFGLNFNIGPAPSYVAPAPVMVPVPVAVAPNPYVVRPAYPYYAPVYAPAPVYTQRSALRAQVQPSISYSYWRR